MVEGVHVVEGVSCGRGCVVWLRVCRAVEGVLCGRSATPAPGFPTGGVDVPGRCALHYPSGCTRRVPASPDPSAAHVFTSPRCSA